MRTRENKRKQSAYLPEGRFPSGLPLWLTQFHTIWHCQHFYWFLYLSPPRGTKCKHNATVHIYIHAFINLSLGVILGANIWK